MLVKVELAGFSRLPGRITEVPKPFRAVRKTPIQIAGSIPTHIAVSTKVLPPILWCSISIVSIDTGKARQHTLFLHSGHVPRYPAIGIDATTTSPLEKKRGAHVEVLLLAPLDKGNPVVRRVCTQSHGPPPPRGEEAAGLPKAVDLEALRPYRQPFPKVPH